MQILRERDVKIAIGIITLISSTIAFIFTTFATIDYVDEKHVGVMFHFEQQNKRLDRIESAIEKNNALIIESMRRGKKHD